MQISRQNSFRFLHFATSIRKFCGLKDESKTQKRGVSPQLSNSFAVGFVGQGV